MLQLHFEACYITQNSSEIQLTKVIANIHSYGL